MSNTALCSKPADEAKPARPSRGGRGREPSVDVETSSDTNAKSSAAGVDIRIAQIALDRMIFCATVAVKRKRDADTTIKMEPDDTSATARSYEDEEPAEVKEEVQTKRDEVEQQLESALTSARQQRSGLAAHQVLEFWHVYFKSRSTILPTAAFLWRNHDVHVVSIGRNGAVTDIRASCCKWK